MGHMVPKGLPSPKLEQAIGFVPQLGGKAKSVRGRWSIYGRISSLVRPYITFASSSKPHDPSSPLINRGEGDTWIDKSFGAYDFPLAATFLSMPQGYSPPSSSANLRPIWWRVAESLSRCILQMHHPFNPWSVNHINGENHDWDLISCSRNLHQCSFLSW